MILALVLDANCKNLIESTFDLLHTFMKIGTKNTRIKNYSHKIEQKLKTKL